MSFAVPIAWGLLAIAIPIIALYVLKVRLRRVPTSTNMFWKQVYEEKPPRAWWQNLRHLLSLLAQLLILLFLVTAIADPYFLWQTQQARRIVLVLDTSASMNATDVAPTRLEAVRTAAHQVLDGLRFRDQVAIIVAGSRPEVVLGMAGHTPTLRRALDSIQASDNAGCLPDAIQLARRLIGQHPTGEVLVFSDGCQATDEQLLQMSFAAEFVASPATKETAALAPTNEANAANEANDSNELATTPSAATNAAAVHLPQFRFLNTATQANNVGITQFQARRSLVDPLGYQILLSVKNHSSEAVVGRLELTLNDVPIDVLPLKLQAEELWTRTLDKTTLEGGQIHAKLTELALAPLAPLDAASSAGATETKAAAATLGSINALLTDDQAWAIVPPRQMQNVLIVSPGNLFLRKVFEANPLVNVTITDAVPESWPSDTIVVLHRVMPDVIPDGRVLVIDPEIDTNLWKLGDLIQNPIITEQDSESPLMTHIRLDNVMMPDARRFEFREPVQSLASTLDGEPILAVIPRTSGPCLVLGVNLERSDLAFRTTFPILVTNALAWFAGQAGEVERSWNAGEMATLTTAKLQATTAPLLLLSPTARESKVAGSQMGPLDEVGLWQIVADQSNESNDPKAGVSKAGVSNRDVIERLAVNLSHEGESDLRPRRLQAVSDAGNSGPANSGPANSGRLNSESPGVASLPLPGWFSRPLWFYLAAMMALFVVIEWALYQRRWIS